MMLLVARMRPQAVGHQQSVRRYLDEGLCEDDGCP